MAVNPEDPAVVGPRAAPAVTVPPAPLRSPTARVGEAYGGAVAEAVDGAFAALAVTAALVRYAADTAVHRRPGLRVPLPFTRGRPSLRRALRRPIAMLLVHPASAAVRALSVAADDVVPEVVRGVLARLDVPALVREFVDVDRLAAMLDVDAVVARVDIDAVLDRVDLDAIAARLDLDAVAARLDLDTLIDKVDISRVLDRVDLDLVVSRVDLDRAVDRVDLDRAVDRVDVDRVISRTDVAGLARYVVQEIDLPGLLRTSTGSVTSEMVRGVRDQGADADRAVERVVDRLLHRHGRRTGPAEQPALPGSEDRP
jgi:hypothetical protein